ncbi:hypothetical protein RYX36_001380 [Vicia faba]
MELVLAELNEEKVKNHMKLLRKWYRIVSDILSQSGLDFSVEDENAWNEYVKSHSKSQSFHVQYNAKRPIFNQLRNRGIGLDQFSFVAVVKAYGRSFEVGFGRGVYGVVVKSGNGMFVDLSNTLLQFYCVVEELKMHMCCVGIKAIAAAMLSRLAWLVTEGGLFWGSLFMVTVSKLGLVMILNVVTVLIDMYSKTGRVYLAQKVFDGLVEKDVVLWNCLITIYARNCLVEEAVALLQKMRYEGVRLN